MHRGVRPLALAAGCMTLLLFLGWMAPASAARIEPLYAVGSTGWPDNDSRAPQVSNDGMCAAYLSSATNLVPGETGQGGNLYLFRRQVGETLQLSQLGPAERIQDFALSDDCSSAVWTVAGLGVSAAGSLKQWRVADGQVRDLVLPVLDTDGNGQPDRTARYQAMGMAGNGRSIAVSLLYDSGFGLVTESVLYDIATGVERSLPFVFQDIDLSQSGGVMAFTGPEALVAEDNNDETDVYVYLSATQTVTLVSADRSGKSGAGSSGSPSVSDDGRLILFESEAPDLVNGDRDSWSDVFLYDRQSATMTLVSIGSSRDDSLAGSLSGDGTVAAFVSFDDGVVAGDSNGVSDVFVWRDSSGTVSRASLSAAGKQATGASSAPSLDRGGDLLAFESEAGNLVDADTGDFQDVFLATLSLPYLPGNVSATAGTLSDRVRVSWVPSADATAYRVERRLAGGWEVLGTVSGSSLDDDSVPVSSLAAYRIVPLNAAGEGGSTDPVSGYAGPPPAPEGVVASDGQYPFVRIFWNPVSGSDAYAVYRAPGSGGADVLVGTTSASELDDRVASPGTVFRYTVRSRNGFGLGPAVPGDLGIAGADADNDGLADGVDPDADDDGMADSWERRFGLSPASSSDASADKDGDGLANRAEYQVGGHPLLADTDRDGVSDAADPSVADADQDGVAEPWTPLFVTAERRLTSGAGGSPSGAGPGISSDGRLAVFDSSAGDLIAGDDNGLSDVFLVNRETGVIRRMSATERGQGGNGASLQPHISSDGSTVVFLSKASNLDPDSPNTPGAGRANVLLASVATGAIEQLTKLESFDAADPSLSEDGSVVTFRTVEALVSSDTNGVSDVYAWERAGGRFERVSVTGSGGQGSAGSFDPAISANGRYVAFRSSHGFAPGVPSGTSQVYVKDRQTGAVDWISRQPGRRWWQWPQPGPESLGGWLDCRVCIGRYKPRGFRYESGDGRFRDGSPGGSSDLPQPRAGPRRGLGLTVRLSRWPGCSLPWPGNCRNQLRDPGLCLGVRRECDSRECRYGGAAWRCRQRATGAGSGRPNRRLPQPGGQSGAGGCPWHQRYFCRGNGAGRHRSLRQRCPAARFACPGRRAAPRRAGTFTALCCPAALTPGSGQRPHGRSMTVRQAAATRSGTGFPACPPAAFPMP